MVVMFKNLGRYGKMGNGLFQIAATIGYAKKHRVDFAFPQWEHSAYFQLPQDKFNNNLLKTSVQYEESSFLYSEIPFKKNCNLHGYFQSWRYFDNCSNYIREIFAPRQNYETQGLSGVCSIHVRRTDYLQFPNHHPVIDMNYYEAAMEMVPSSDFIVFSDDVEYCKSKFKSTNGKSIIVQDVKDQYTDFFSMASCGHSIIANSSFSWWAAWLGQSQDRVVVAPKNWFGPALNATHPIDDLIPTDWVLV